MKVIEFLRECWKSLFQNLYPTEGQDRHEIVGYGEGDLNIVLGPKFPEALLRQFRLQVNRDQIVSLLEFCRHLGQPEYAEELDAEFLPERFDTPPYFTVRDSGGLLSPQGRVEIILMPVFGTDTLVAFRIYNYFQTLNEHEIRALWRDFAPIARRVRQDWHNRDDRHADGD